ncbi:MAG: nicotinate-nucleotide--dimethylbenzimidazole phosphoribosyltransferase [Lentisphaerae bacterium GWF2_45_14]|nr:MAG: nicotinate-nucleotide--dimethylbenzimidazole phosphoribosyltransferase [Lentisphaerae bacterium GWF2_45_14]
MDLKNVISSVILPDKDVEKLAWARLDSLTKPQRSLGMLEECAVKYVAARGDINASIEKATVLTFAGDHGVAEEGVSAFPQEVTAQMVANFASGGAAVNVLAKLEDVTVRIIDAGVAADCPFQGVIQRKVARGTANFTKGPAMSVEDAQKAIFIGIEEAWKAIDEGATLIATGDMGIANTTASTALYSAFLDIPPRDITGRGTGIDEHRLIRKIQTIEEAINVNCSRLNSPLEIMAALGGFEIAGICGAVIGAAARKVPVVIDGFISGAAALCAIKLNRDIASYCFFGHLSADSGHRRIMGEIGVKPLLDLDMRLGEGTGAVLAIHIIRAGLKIMREMATFEQAGVSKS